VIERRVLRSRKRPDGVVTALVNKGAEWSPRLVEDVRSDLRSGRYRYVVPWSTGFAEVRVVDGDEVVAACGPDGEPAGLAMLPDG
jgi:hypothetical protein